MPINKALLFSQVLNNFLELNNEVEAVIVSDQDGFIIAGEKRKDIDIEIVSLLTTVVKPISDRVRDEFSFKQFGTTSIDTAQHRLLFVSLDEDTTLSLVIESLGSIDNIAPYAYFLAEKTAQILNASEEDSIQIHIPDFKYEEELSKQSERLKNQIYQNKLNRDGIYRFKFIIIGDHEVGKTSIIRRFVEKRFLVNYRTTIGLNILSYDFEAFNNKISLFLWDIGAQQYFKRYRKTYYSGAQAAFMVFDLTNKRSFDDITIWHNELKEFIENKDLPIIIIGNKSDLKDQRVVSYEEGVKLTKDLSELSTFSNISSLSEFADLSYLSDQTKSKISYIETSALTGENVEDAFKLVSYHFMMRSIEIEEQRVKDQIVGEIKSIVDLKKSLSLTFITKDLLWSPALQIITEIKELGSFSKKKENEKEKSFEYSNGLIVKNYSYDNYKISESDGIFCIFDAREKEHINLEWREMILNIVRKVKKNKVILIGIQVSDKVDWSKLMNEFNINEEAEEKMVSVLFFKIGTDYRLEIVEQLIIMLNTIKNLVFNY